MKAELTKDGYFKCWQDKAALSIALQYIFLKEQDPD